MEPRQFFKELSVKAKELQFDSVNQDENGLSVWLSHYTALGFHIRITDSRPFFYAIAKTNSWFYNGDRTDIHDLFSISIAAVWKKFGIASALEIDIENPVAPTLDDFEIYGRFILPEQLDFNSELSEDSINSLTELFVHLKFFEGLLWQTFEGCPCDECRMRLGFKYDFKPGIPESLENTFSILNRGGENISSSDRKLPTWTYFRNFDDGISVVYSHEFSKFLLAFADEEIESLDGLSGELLIDRHFKFLLPNKVKDNIKAVEAKLELRVNGRLVLENKAIFLLGSWIIIYDGHFGLNAFKKEKSLLKDRHSKEFRILFAESIIKWRSKLDGGLFESLIKELLEREAIVSWVRKASHTNEADGGVDLIAEIKVPKEQKRLKEDQSPYYFKRIIVQCKAFGSGVGKSDVLDIRDTIEHYNCDGFLLVVSSHIKRGLSEHLDRLRASKKLWIDWWTMEEINDRIQEFPELVSKYSGLFISR